MATREYLTADPPQYDRDASTIHQMDNGRWVIAWWDGDGSGVYTPGFAAPMWTSEPGRPREDSRATHIEGFADAYGVTNYGSRSAAKRARRRVLGF